MIVFDNKGRLLEGSSLKVKPMGEWVKKPIPIEVFQVEGEFIVETLEGKMKGKKNDYLIIGVEGEPYPCDRKIFEKTYRRKRGIDDIEKV